MTGASIAQNELGFTGEGVKVAVMDTGIDFSKIVHGEESVEWHAAIPASGTAVAAAHAGGVDRL